jgi:hypothetical protein
MKHRKSPQRVCLFCGKSGHAKITGEHVWPQWIYGVLKMSPQVQTVHLDGLMREQRKWHASQKASFRVNEVREQCNSEWLSNLETRSEPVLTPLIASNERTTLSAADQRVLEEWVLKMSPEALVTP